MAELRWIADGWAHSIDMPEREAIEKAGMMWRQRECEMVEVIRRSYIIFRRQKKSEASARRDRRTLRSEDASALSDSLSMMRFRLPSSSLSIP